MHCSKWREGKNSIFGLKNPDFLTKPHKNEELKANSGHGQVQFSDHLISQLETDSLKGQNITDLSFLCSNYSNILGYLSDQALSLSFATI